MTMGLKANADGSGAIQVGGSDAITITSGLVVSMNGGTPYPLVSGTSVSASGTSVNFTDIPSWVKRITVMFSGVSTSGTSSILIQIGYSGGIENTGYASFVNTFDGSPGGTVFTAGFGVNENVNSSSLLSGHLVLTNVSGNIWVESVVMGATGAILCSIGGGTKTLSGTLDRVRITTVNGTDTFDAGSINILYE
jgi:hypothetical protein